MDKQQERQLQLKAECDEYTQERCGDKFRSLKAFIATLFALIAVFLGLVVYATSQAATANKNYHDVYTQMIETRTNTKQEIDDIAIDLKTYQVGQKASEKEIIGKLSELQAELSSQRVEQRALLERILQLQIDLAKKNGSAR